MSAALEQTVGEPEAELTDGFHLVIDALKLNGIKTIYNVPGIPITDLGRLAQAEGMRVISFRHEQNAGNAAAIAGFLTKSPGVCLTVSAPGFLNGLVALANATTNCFPMILISGSSEREIVDLQQGDYEEMDQLAIARPLCKAAFRVLHAADIGIGVARAIRAAVSGRPGGVYLDLPGKLFGQVMEVEAGRRSLVKVIDPAPAQLPAPIRRRARARRAARREASVDHPRQGRRLCAGRRRHPRIGREERHSLHPDEHGQGPAARPASAMRRRRAFDRAGRQRRRADDRRAAQLAAQSRQGQAVGPAGLEEVHPDRHRAARDGQQRRDRRAAGGRHRLLRGGAAARHGRRLEAAAGGVDAGDQRQEGTATSPGWRPGLARTRSRWTTTPRCACCAT